jgi:glycosyltransferase involved in cell wall biosynthesis
MRGWTQKLQGNLENLVRRADLIIAMGEQIAAALPFDGPDRAHVIQHGVDEKLLEIVQTATMPEDLRSVAGPRIGYFGRISQKIDFQMILGVAKARPAWQWIILGVEAGLGPAEAENDNRLWRACMAQPNVHFLGRRSSAEIPLYMRGMDALVLPYKTGTTGYWTMGFPLKLFECFASGKPTVAADTPAIRPYGHLINLARTQDDWIAALNSVLAGQDKSSPDERFAYARDNTWQQRTDLLEAQLLSLLTFAQQWTVAASDQPGATTWKRINGDSFPQ